MTVIIVDGHRVGSTRCSECGGHVTLEQLALGSAYLTVRVNHDSANGYEVMHNECASRTGSALFIGANGRRVVSSYQSPYGDDEPF